MRVTPTLGCDGTAREAMQTYRDVLGGDLVVVTFADAGQAPAGSDHGDRVMHAVLTAGDLHVYAADRSPAPHDNPSEPPAPGVTLTLWGSGDEAPSLRAAFDRLAEGGEVTLPLSRQPWGQELGALRDRFGVAWNLAIYTDQG